MRFRRNVSLLAAVFALAGAGSPAALGFANRAPASIAGVQKAAAMPSSAAGSDSFVVVGIAGGGLALGIAGAAGARLTSRRRSGAVRISSGS
jgi:hypothetical protein